MPTKPLTQPEYWATDAVYTTGPFIGQPQKVVPPGAFAAEGHRPGSLFPTPAEYENSQQHNITGLARWVFAGAFTGAADAHVVETDAFGRSALVGLTLDDAVDETVLSVTGVNTLAPTVTVVCTTGATCVDASMGASDGTGFSVQTGAGAAPTGYAVVMVGSGVNAAGLRGSADALTSGVLIDLEHAGTGACIDARQTNADLVASFTQSGTGTLALSVAGGTTAAIICQGDGTGAGLRALSGTTAGANGVTASCSNNSGFGLSATTSAGATSSSRGVRAIGLNNGVGIEATAVSGEGGRFSASGASGAALYLPGKASNPTNTFDGRMDWNTTARALAVSDQDDNDYRYVWTSLGGLALGQTTGNSATTAGGAAWVLAATLNLTGSNAPKRASRTLVLRFTCMSRSILGVGVANTLNVRIRDTTAAVTIITRAGAGAGAAAGYYIPPAPAAFDWTTAVVLDVAYTIPSAGDRTFVVEIQTGGANNIQVRDAALIPFGLI